VGAGGGATMSAFVEIEFDNTDRRFPTSKLTYTKLVTVSVGDREGVADLTGLAQARMLCWCEGR